MWKSLSRRCKTKQFSNHFEWGVRRNQSAGCTWRRQAETPTDFLGIAFVSQVSSRTAPGNSCHAVLITTHETRQSRPVWALSLTLKRRVCLSCSSPHVRFGTHTASPRRGIYGLQRFVVAAKRQVPRRSPMSLHGFTLSLYSSAAWWLLMTGARKSALLLVSVYFPRGGIWTCLGFSNQFIPWWKAAVMCNKIRLSSIWGKCQICHRHKILSHPL